MGLWHIYVAFQQCLTGHNKQREWIPRVVKGLLCFLEVETNHIFLGFAMHTEYLGRMINHGSERR